jgi:hypothetical protein
MPIQIPSSTCQTPNAALRFAFAFTFVDNTRPTNNKQQKWEVSLISHNPRFWILIFFYFFWQKKKND